MSTVAYSITDRKSEILLVQLGSYNAGERFKNQRSAAGKSNHKFTLVIPAVARLSLLITSAEQPCYQTEPELPQLYCFFGETDIGSNNAKNPLLTVI